MSGEKRGRMEGQKENVKHGDVFLPVNSYHCLVPETYRELALHWHEEMEITLIREGSSDYRVGQTFFRANEGDLVIVPPFTLHSVVELPGHTMVSDSLVFHLSFLGASDPDLSAAKYLRPLLEGRLTAPVQIRAGESGYTKICESFCGALETFTHKAPFYELLLKENLLHTIYLLFNEGYFHEKNDGAPKRETSGMQTVLRYIEDHYADHIDVPELASISGFSESYFMSYFKQTVGMTSIRYINHVRIHKAAQALENTTQPIMEIAMDHGFDNISYFNLQFRREFNMTPRQFRAKYRSRQ